MSVLWEHRKINANGSWTYGASVDFTLPSEGMLSALMIIGSATPVTDARNALEKWRFIDYINVVNVSAGGSEPFKNLTGRLAHVEQYLDGGAAMMQQYFNYGSSTERFRLALNFGRWFKDIGYGLDLSKLPQTKLTLTNDAAVGIYSAVATPTVIAVLAPKGSVPSWSQYCQSKIYQEILAVQAGNYAVKFSQMGLLRRFLLQIDPAATTAENADATLYSIINNMKLTHRSGADVKWDDSPRNLWYNDAFERGRDLFQGGEIYTTDAYGVRTGLGQTQYKAAVTLRHSGTQGTYPQELNPGDDSSTQQRVANSDAEQGSFLFQGFGLENTLPYRYDTYDDISACPDLNAEKDIDLALTSADSSSVANAKIKVVQDRVMGYQA